MYIYFMYLVYRFRKHVLVCHRDEEFSVSSVLASDVIHATRKDVPCIFRVWDFASDPWLTSDRHVFWPLLLFSLWSGDVIAADFAALFGVSAGAGGERSREEEVGKDPGESAEHPEQEPAEEPTGPCPARGLRCLAAHHQDCTVCCCAGSVTTSTKYSC